MLFKQATNIQKIALSKLQIPGMFINKVKEILIFENWENI